MVEFTKRFMFFCIFYGIFRFYDAKFFFARRASKQRKTSDTPFFNYVFIKTQGLVLLLAPLALSSLWYGGGWNSFNLINSTSMCATSSSSRCWPHFVGMELRFKVMTYF
ncbi:MAG: hypothetical protein QM786_12465 [Breznakibacter sp.]